MDVAKQTLQQTLKSPNRYTIPLFQRHYSWKKPNWVKLWEDIGELREDETDGRTHFMGSLVFVSEKSSPKKLPAFQVIDGQQRLTTLTLLLSAIRDQAAALAEDQLAEEIYTEYLIHKFKTEEEKFRVYPRHRDRESYQSAIEAEGDCNGSIQEAMKYFKEQLGKDVTTQTSGGLRDLFDLLVARLEFVHITLDGESPYRIFSSLNSTGVDLTEADLIRNFMFMHVPANKQQAFDRDQWEPLEKRFEIEKKQKDGSVEAQLDGKAISAFHRDFLMREGKYIGPTATFETFERRYDVPNFDPEFLTLELEEAANLYDMIRGKADHSDKVVNTALRRFRDLDTSTAYPLVLNLLERWKNQKLSENELAKCLQLLSGFILRRLVCDQQSRAYGRWFVTACKEVGDNAFDDLRGFLTEKDEGKGIPSDDLFKERFKSFNLYNSGYAKAILRELEINHPDFSHKERIDLSLPKIEIEHIMPQTLSKWWIDNVEQAVNVHAKWLHTIGNLTLTGYNQDYGNRSFNEKKNGEWTTSHGQKVHGYVGSHIALTKEVAKNDSWDEQTIVKRANQLADLAAKIWIGE